MAAFNKFNSFVEALGRKVHNLDADTLKVMLTNVLPVATNSVKANITEIAAGNGYVAGGVIVANNAFAQVGGVATLVGDDPIITAVGGSIGPAQWAVLYNDTALNDELIGWWAYPAPFTLLDTEAIKIDFDQVAGILDLT